MDFTHNTSLLSKAKVCLDSKEFCLIGCDGFCGAGKTTFVKDLQKFFILHNLKVEIIHLDNFIKEKRYRSIYSTLYDYDLSRVEKELLKPLKNRQTTLCKLYDWVSDSFKESISLKPEGIIIVEGVNSCDEKIKKYFDICIFIKAKKELREKRVELRGDFTKVEFEHWTKSEEEIFKDRDIEKYYDFIYNSEKIG